LNSSSSSSSNSICSSTPAGVAATTGGNYNNYDDDYYAWMKQASKLRWGGLSHDGNYCTLEPFDDGPWQPAATHRPGELIVILQYGKCGSSAMTEYMTLPGTTWAGAGATDESNGGSTSSRKAPPSVWHVHGIEDEQLKEQLAARQQNNETIWIVTMVRNRFVRDISSLFENSLFYNITENTTVPEIIAKDKVVWYSDAPRISQHWFTDRFLDGTGIDIVSYAEKFNFSQRSLFVEKGLFRVLLLRYEDISYWGRILPKYFPNHPQDFPQVNPTGGKASWIDKQYSNVLATIPFTDEEIQQTLGGETARFYTPCERDGMARAAANPLPAAWIL